jgi:phenylalanyl-tRNA synthetase beta chain
VNVPTPEIADIFARLALPAAVVGEGAAAAFTVTPPSYRFDIAIEEDLIEEVARVYGFERIPAEPPRAPAAMHGQPEGYRSLHALRAALASSGYQEVINFSFVEPGWEADLAGCADPIRLLNPIASQLSVMRTSLLAGLVANVRYNINRKATRVRVFELGRVFLRQAGAQEEAFEVAGIRQPMRVGAAAFGPAAPEQWGAAPRPVDFYDVKGDLEDVLAPLTARFEPAPHPALHPGRSARVAVEGRDIGWVGELHPRWQQKYELPGPVVLFEVDAAALQRVPVPVYREVPRFPPVTRDLSVTLPEEIRVQDVLEDLLAHRPAAVEAIHLFDHYRGAGVENGKKSLAFRVLLQDTQKTMTDAEVDAAVQQVRQRLQERFGGKFRQ